MRGCTVFVSGFLAMVLLLSVVSPSVGSLLPWLDRRSGGSLSEQFMDPFKILERVPFGLDRDDMATVALARVDWRETPNSHEIVLDVPGMRKEDLKIEVEDNRILRVSGERKREEEEKKGEHWHRVERTYGKFWRQFRLPENVDLDSVKAKLENGVLTLNFAKLAPEKIKGPKVVSIDQEDRTEVKEKEKASSVGETKRVEL
ncbi:22.0 kDa heat shock protein-like [Carex rostrata]